MTWLKILLVMAARPRPTNPSDVMNLTVVLGVGVPLIVLAIGAPLYYFLRDDEDEAEDGTDPDSSLLAQIEAARDEGEIDDEEYQRVRTLLAQRLNPAAPPTESSTTAVNPPNAAPDSPPPASQNGGSPG